jgi:dihydrolipoamide dehydrogenase
VAVLEETVFPIEYMSKDPTAQALIKVVARKGVVKGIHIVGEKATEIIHEGVRAIMSGATVESMAQVIRAHPTFSEIYSEAFHLLEGRPVHYYA